MTAAEVAICDEPIHDYFELSYSRYLVLPRSVLQSMPAEWQRRFVSCLCELDDTIDWQPAWPNQYLVSLWDHRRKQQRSINDDPFNDYDRGRRRIAFRTGIALLESGNTQEQG